VHGIAHGAATVPAAATSFAGRIVAWQRAHGRHDLPWQRTRDPYRLWLAEIMLQQTQVATVRPYYERFLARFPDVPTLAAASEEEVLTLWAGLGYYRRARNLHAAARAVVAEHGGQFPRSVDALAALPGIGRSTAAAIAAFAWDVVAPILDGNVKRVLARHAAVEAVAGSAAAERTLWRLAGERLPQSSADMVAYTQGSMDLGATVCTRGAPDCARCPVADDCVARATGRSAELPRARTRPALTERRGRFLLLTHGADVAMVKRPGQGVWGALWCLPELPLDASDAEIDAIAARFGARALGARQTLADVRHRFTHFQLTFATERIACARREPHAAEPGVLWLALDAAAEAAVPKPIAQLLRRGAADETSAS